MSAGAPGCYCGFWRRLGATLIDGLLWTLLAAIVLVGLHFAELAMQDGIANALERIGRGELAELPDSAGDWRSLVVDYGMPFVLTVILWVRFMATPGKILMNCFVVDARTGKAVRPARAVLRYLAYIVSLLPAGLGFLWIAWDPQKRGFHDIIARTRVIDQADDLSAQSLEELARNSR